MIAPLTDEQQTIGGHCQPCWLRQLTSTTAATADSVHEHTLRGEHLQPVVAIIGDDNAILRISRDAKWEFELTITIAFLADSKQELEFGIEDLHSMIVGVTDQHSACTV